jgi:hypothetical protein
VNLATTLSYRYETIGGVLLESWCPWPISPVTTRRLSIRNHTSQEKWLPVLKLAYYETTCNLNPVLCLSVIARAPLRDKKASNDRHHASFDASVMSLVGFDLVGPL